MFKAVIRAVSNYAAPVWSPLLSSTSYQKIQVAQNTSLRVITGCTRTSPIPHLHSETSILQVRAHTELLASQYLAAALQPEHPSFDLVTADPPPRLVKKTLASLHRTTVNNASGPSLKQTIQNLHTHHVQTEIRNAPLNKLLHLRNPCLLYTSPSPRDRG